MLAKLAARLDAARSAKNVRAFREGWPSASCDGVRFYDTPKTQYRYREAGAGPVVVFAADPPVTLELYDDLLALYSRRFRVIVVEMPAMGFSAVRKNFDFSFRATNDDLALFLRDVAGPGAVLAFSCVAGLGAVDVAVRYPDLVSRLVLIQTTDWKGFQDWKRSRDPKKILGKPFVGQIMMRKLAPSRVGVWFDLALGNRERLEPYCACASETLRRGAGWALATAFQTYLAGEASPLGKPSQPVTVIWGKGDRSHPPQSIERARMLAENVEVIESEAFGHFGELEATSEVYEIISTRVSPA